MYSGRSNLIIGYHGCDAHVRDALLTRPDVIHKSEKPFDWLGHGVYFWENNHDRALQWATDKAERGKLKNSAVIGAVLSLGHCFDLLDSHFINQLRTYHALMAKSHMLLGKPLPKNKDVKGEVHGDKVIRELDCAVIEFMHESVQRHIERDKSSMGFSSVQEFDSVRGVFTEGGPAYEGAGIQLKNHIQICVRNPNCIIGFFKPRKTVEFP